MLGKIRFIPVSIVERLKILFHCRTYHIEASIVLAVLVSVALFTEKGAIEYIGVAAVFFTFMHAQIAEYMREAEAFRAGLLSDASFVRCFYKLPYYFYAKEICWLTYFVLLGANSAIVGVIIFLIYQPWRNLWRQYHPR